MALRKRFKTKYGFDVEEGYLRLEYVGFAALHHKEKAVMVAHFQVFADEAARREGLPFVDTLDVEVPLDPNLLNYVYRQARKLPELLDAEDA